MCERKAVGIDLGTTNSVVAFVNKEGRPEVISSREGGRLVPSVYAVAEDGTELVGQSAVDQEPANPENTVRSIKRLMGQCNDDGTPARVVVAGRTLSPEEVSASILRKLKEDAEAALGCEVSQAVITVPAYFNDGQRTATKLAGELAGLEVLRVINEPTAAALSYGIERKENQKILVYDLGGGTFDVTLLEITYDEGAYDFIVRATGGDTALGGDDFDAEIVKMLRMALPPSAIVDVAVQKRLRTAAESLKKQLSAVKRASVNIPFVAIDEQGQPVGLSFSIERDDLERAVAPLLTRTKECIDRAVEDAKWAMRDIDEVVFVGGSTRVPAVYESVKKWTGRDPNRSINPDEAVAVGAAVQAALLTNQSKDDIVLFDVTPLSLGIEDYKGHFVRMIKRNQRIPYSRTETFTTAEDNQDKVEVRVSQGERLVAKHNMKVGSFHLMGIEPAPKGTAEIEVTFTIDANGILSVKATDTKTGSEKEVVLTGAASLTSDEVKRLLEEGDKHRDSDEKAIQLERAYEKLRKRSEQIKTLLKDAMPLLGDEIATELTDADEAIADALETEHYEYLQQAEKAAKEAVEKASKRLYDHASAAIKGLKDED
jgi:molecular chaperone DnaK